MGLEWAGVHRASRGRCSRCDCCLPQTPRQSPHRASRDKRLLDGVDCGSGWQPDLPSLTQRRNCGIELCLARGGDCRSGVAGRFLKMKLIYPATVALRNCNDIVVDFDLFTLFGQVTEQVGDVAPDGAYVRTL